MKWLSRPSRRSSHTGNNYSKNWRSRALSETTIYDCWRTSQPWRSKLASSRLVVSRVALIELAMSWCRSGTSISTPSSVSRPKRSNIVSRKETSRSRTLRYSSVIIRSEWRRYMSTSMSTRGRAACGWLFRYDSNISRST